MQDVIEVPSLSTVEPRLCRVPHRAPPSNIQCMPLHTSLPHLPAPSPLHTPRPPARVHLATTCSNPFQPPCKTFTINTPRPRASTMGDPPDNLAAWRIQQTPAATRSHACLQQPLQPLPHTSPCDPCPPDSLTAYASNTSLPEALPPDVSLQCLSRIPAAHSPYIPPPQNTCAHLTAWRPGAAPATAEAATVP